MITYKLELKPVRSIGLDNMSEDKRKMLHMSVNLVAHMLNMHEKIHSAKANEDLSLTIIADDDAEEDIQKMHKEAILTKLD